MSIIFDTPYKQVVKSHFFFHCCVKLVTYLYIFWGFYRIELSEYMKTHEALRIDRSSVSVHIMLAFALRLLTVNILFTQFRSHTVHSACNQRSSGKEERLSESR